MSKSKPSGGLTAGRPSSKGQEKTLASLADKPTMRRVNFDLPAEMHDKLKINAIRQGKTIKELLTDFVDELPDV